MERCVTIVLRSKPKFPGTARSDSMVGSLSHQNDPFVGNSRRTSSFELFRFIVVALLFFPLAMI
jgi:hypothetical protein